MEQFVDRAYLYHEIGEYNKALLDYNKAIELDPDDMDYLFTRSLNYEDLEEYEKAISSFKSHRIG